MPATKTRKPNTAELLPFDDYDVVIISFSGGKDSLASMLHVIDEGCPLDKIELWHQCVDGAPGTHGLMDWPVTEAYVKAVGAAFGIPVRFQWKVGGFEREMLRNQQSTETVGCELREGTTTILPRGRSRPSTRRKFPQKSRDLSVRWCSPYLKIDVCARAISNDPTLKNATVLMVTGERAEEGGARATCAVVEKHRCHTKHRTVHAWRPVADWAEQQVWDIIRKHGVRPHPAYEIGFGRVSCMTCIFGNADQWATVRALDPDRFEKIAAYEKDFGKTIGRKQNVVESADAGSVYDATTNEPDAVARAMSHEEYPDGELIIGTVWWEMPAGAFKECGGPS